MKIALFSFVCRKRKKSCPFLLFFKRKLLIKMDEANLWLLSDDKGFQLFLSNVKKSESTIKYGRTTKIIALKMWMVRLLYVLLIL